MSDENQVDLFDDQPAAEVISKDVTDDTPAKADETPDGKTGDENPSGTPPEDGKDDNKEGADGKLIPEHRFKAALKQVTDKLDAATQELATLKATPIPDKATDPEGYAYHVRMEASKEVMRETKTDYDEVIAHFVGMGKINPMLFQAVADHPIPAKYAYDIAKKDLEIKELQSLKGSDEWKEFQEFKKNKEKVVEIDAKDKVSQQVTNSLGKVPNLNRATDVSRGSSVPQSDDELFVGAL